MMHSLSSFSLPGSSDSIGHRLFTDVGCADVFSTLSMAFQSGVDLRTTLIISCSDESFLAAEMKEVKFVCKAASV